MSFTVQLVSPEQVLFEGEADMVVCRTLGGGDIAFLEGHAPFLGALAIWPVRLKTDQGEVSFASHGGFVQVGGGGVIVLSDVAELGGDIDVERARRALATAEAALASDPDDADAASAAQRARTRLEVAATTAH
jgi:F-type H+-transporting ATPase subunit epsilon